MAHVLARHAVGGAKSAGKSTFLRGTNIPSLIRNAATTQAKQQANGNLQRIIDAGRKVGIDRVSGLLTSLYTVITDAAGNLVTAFPGLPG